jgi:hypothetical protein
LPAVKRSESMTLRRFSTTRSHPFRCAAQMWRHFDAYDSSRQGPIGPCVALARSANIGPCTRQGGSPDRSQHRRPHLPQQPSQHVDRFGVTLTHRDSAAVSRTDSRLTAWKEVASAGWRRSRRQWGGWLELCGRWPPACLQRLCGVLTQYRPESGKPSSIVGRTFRSKRPLARHMGRQSAFDIRQGSLDALA